MLPTLDNALVHLPHGTDGLEVGTVLIMTVSPVFSSGLRLAALVKKTLKVIGDVAKGMGFCNQPDSGSNPALSAHE